MFTPHCALDAQYAPNPILNPCRRPDLLDVTVTLGGIADGKAQPNGTSGWPVLDDLLERGLVKWKSEGNRRQQFKYVLDLPGNSAAWRLGETTMGGGAMIIKSQTPWNE